jgi:RNA polymerase sigma-70 factor (ECF subfamily)
VSATATIPAGKVTQDDLFNQASADFGAPLERLARAYEADPDLRRDLLQEIYIALWRSFAGFDHRCSLRTWIYRVAHNAATSHVIRQRRAKGQGLVSIEELESLPEAENSEDSAGRAHALDRLMGLIQRLKPLDRQVILLYLEGWDAASTGEVTGLSSRYVSTKIYRIKEILTHRFHAGGTDHE